MKRKFVKAIAIGLVFLMLLPIISSCGGPENYKSFAYAALDSTVTVKLSANRIGGGRLSGDEIEKISKELEEKVAQIDLSISETNPHSEIYAINNSAGVLISESDATHALFDSAYTITELTGGAYDCTIGALTALWDADFGIVPTEDEIAEAMEHVGPDKFTVNGKAIKKNDVEAKIDASSIKNGIAAQKILEYIASTDSACGVVSVGNTVGVYGEKSKHSTFKISVKDPVGELLGDFYIASGFISTASVNDSFFEQNGKKYHGIIDPRIGRPAESSLLEVIVCTSNGGSSAALSRALFVLGSEFSMELYNSGEISFEAIFVTESGELILTPGIDANMFDLKSNDYKIKQ